MGAKKRPLSPAAVLDEASLLAFFEGQGIHSGEKHAQRLWRALIQRGTPLTREALSALNPALPRKVCELVPEHFRLLTSRVVRSEETPTGDSTKMVVELQDGHQVECVVMRHPGRNTLCISSQIGCQMGCTFCATGTMGIIGNLCAGEILEQLVHAREVEPSIRNVVFMGMGEPLNNYEAVAACLRAMTDSRRFGLSFSHITVSTVGVIPNMRRLTRDFPSVNLALSLHAPNQEKRLEIVPTASGYPLDRLMAAVDDYLANTTKPSQGSRGAMIEYVLLSGVNMDDSLAHELGALLAPRDVVLNLIPWNPVGELAHRAPSEEQVRHFIEIVSGYGVFTKIRKEFGQEVSGACGQLALQTGAGNKKTREIEDLVGDRGRRAKGRRNSAEARNPERKDADSGGGDNGKKTAGRWPTPSPAGTALAVALACTLLFALARRTR